MFSRVYVEITNVCNKSCGFCHGTKREKRFMSPDEFRRICAGLRGHTRYICLHLMGEPLLHPELETILDIAKEEGLKVCITTNGSLSDARGELLSGDRLYKLSVSLHSFEENGGEGLMQYLNSVWSLCERLSAEGVICALRLWNGGGKNSKNGEILYFLRRHGASFEDTKRPGSVKLKDGVFLENADIFEWPDMSADECGVQFCRGLRDHVGVLCDGTVVPCCLDADGELALGNLLTTPLSDIVSGEKARSIYDGFSARKPAEELCRRCGYATRFGK